MKDAAEYVGMSKRKAQNTVEERNLIFRCVSVDGEMFLGYPEDVRTDRVCVELTNGVVTKATIQ